MTGKRMDCPREIAVTSNNTSQYSTTDNQIFNTVPSGKGFFSMVMSL